MKKFSRVLGIVFVVCIYLAPAIAWAGLVPRHVLRTDALILGRVKAPFIKTTINPQLLDFYNNLQMNLFISDPGENQAYFEGKRGTDHLEIGIQDEPIGGAIEGWGIGANYSNPEREMINRKYNEEKLNVEQFIGRLRNTLWFFNVNSAIITTYDDQFNELVGNFDNVHAPDLQRCSLYDPVMNTWSNTPNIPYFFFKLANIDLYSNHREGYFRLSLEAPLGRCQFKEIEYSWPISEEYDSVNASLRTPDNKPIWVQSKVKINRGSIQYPELLEMLDQLVRDGYVHPLPQN